MLTATVMEGISGGSAPKSERRKAEGKKAPKCAGVPNDFDRIAWIQRKFPAKQGAAGKA